VVSHKMGALNESLVGCTYRKIRGHVLVSIRIDVLYGVSALGSNPGVTVGTFFECFALSKW